MDGEVRCETQPGANQGKQGETAAEKQVGTTTTTTRVLEQQPNLLRLKLFISNQTLKFQKSKNPALTTESDDEYPGGVPTKTNPSWVRTA